MPTASRAVVGMYSFQTPNPVDLARFWGDLMGLPLVEAGPDLVMLDLEHSVAPQTWLFQRGDRQPGDGPLRLDLTTGIDADADAWVALADRAEDLGAVRGERHEVDGVRWIDLRDPDGNPFRVFAPRPD